MKQAGNETLQLLRGCLFRFGDKVKLHNLFSGTHFALYRAGRHDLIGISMLLWSLTGWFSKMRSTWVLKVLTYAIRSQSGIKHHWNQTFFVILTKATLLQHIDTTQWNLAQYSCIAISKLDIARKSLSCFLLSFSLNKVRQTSEKRRLLKEVSGVLFGISMNFELAPLRYRTYRENNSLHQVAYATSLLRKACASIRNPSFGLRKALIWRN